MHFAPVHVKMWFYCRQLAIIALAGASFVAMLATMGCALPTGAPPAKTPTEREATPTADSDGESSLSAIHGWNEDEPEVPFKLCLVRSQIVRLSEKPPDWLVIQVPLKTGIMAVVYARPAVVKAGVKLDMSERTACQSFGKVLTADLPRKTFALPYMEDPESEVRVIEYNLVVARNVPRKLPKLDE